MITFKTSRKNNSKGFTHTAVLLWNDEPLEKATMQYDNRTWERFPFETVKKKVLEKALKRKDLTDNQIKLLTEKLNEL